MATKSFKRQLQQACERFDALRDEIYAAAPDNTTPWERCWLRVPAWLQDQFLNARSRCDQIELDAIAAGKAHRTTLGTLAWYR